MVLSKPIFNALGFYFEQLFNHPVRTKSITCALVATAGNYASQSLAGNKSLNGQSLLAYGLFGLLFGGSIPHYFYSWLEDRISEEVAFPVVRKLFWERLVYSPIYQAFTLYIIARFEGKTHQEAVNQLEKMYWSVLSTSWKYLTVIQFINLSVVPPMLRIFIINIIGFFWTIYIANKRRQAEKDKKK